MEILNNWISGINDLLWSYVLIIMLLGCAFWFTFKTRFVQFRMFREMIRVLGDSANKAHEGEKHISSFQAFAVSLASRVGTGNLTGVATAIAVGGPGAVFWMWIIALLGSASAFVESTLAQLYKRKGKDSFIGGPAYYMRYGLGLNWMGALFAILISVTFGFAFNSVQSNTICEAMQGSFGFDPKIVGAILTVLTLVIIFGGIQRIAKVSSVLVPMMALGYVALALGIVLFNITELPTVIKLIVSSAFGWEQAVGGMVMFGALASLELAWSLADITMAFMTICNLVAISLLSKQAFLLLHDYIAQKRSGIKNPVFDKNKLPELKDKAECW
ncbi:alanine/glycine:cation symporter family protein [Parabacteroides johnsonii]|uniref:alanine/glycine:cation symporter family protein n=1 Tax=Parabacteroides johnsonii TaxID=387661 RepID=UPI0011DC7E39|nr:amino acid carrier protein [Parabacteroides johnsonii]